MNIDEEKTNQDIDYELSPQELEELQSSLDSAFEAEGISVSEELIARTLNAVEEEKKKEKKKSGTRIWGILAGIAATLCIGAVGLTVMLKSFGTTKDSSDKAVVEYTKNSCTEESEKNMVAEAPAATLVDKEAADATGDMSIYSECDTAPACCEPEDDAVMCSEEAVADSCGEYEGIGIDRKADEAFISENAGAPAVNIEQNQNIMTAEAPQSDIMMTGEAENAGADRTACGTDAGNVISYMMHFQTGYIPISLKAPFNDGDIERLTGEYEDEYTPIMVSDEETARNVKLQLEAPADSYTVSMAPHTDGETEAFGDFREIGLVLEQDADGQSADGWEADGQGTDGQDVTVVKLDCSDIYLSEEYMGVSNVWSFLLVTGEAGSENERMYYFRIDFEKQ